MFEKLILTNIIILSQKYLLLRLKSFVIKTMWVDVEGAKGFDVGRRHIHLYLSGQVPAKFEAKTTIHCSLIFRFVVLRFVSFILNFSLQLIDDF